MTTSTGTPPPGSIDLLQLFKLRAAVGRFGEMDHAGWWNTQGVLGARGAAVYRRGLPETHLFARVRVVAAVAAERSRTLYPAASAATLWSLPPDMERAIAFQERSWGSAEARDAWAAFESDLVSPPEDLTRWLAELKLIDDGVPENAARLALEPGGNAIAVPGPISDTAIQLLALGHAQSGLKRLVVPFVSNNFGYVVD